MVVAWATMLLKVFAVDVPACPTIRQDWRRGQNREAMARRVRPKDGPHEGARAQAVPESYQVALKKRKEAADDRRFTPIKNQ